MRPHRKDGVRRMLLIARALAVLAAVAASGCASWAAELEPQPLTGVRLLRADFPKMADGLIVSTQTVRAEIGNAQALEERALAKWGIAQQLWTVITQGVFVEVDGESREYAVPVKLKEMNASLRPENFRVRLDEASQSAFQLSVGVLGMQPEIQVRRIEVREVVLPAVKFARSLRPRPGTTPPERDTVLGRLYRRIALNDPSGIPDISREEWLALDGGVLDGLAEVIEFYGDPVPTSLDLVLARPVYPDRVYTLSLGEDPSNRVVFGGQRTGLAALSETAQLRAVVKDNGEYELTLTSTPNYGTWGKFDYYANFAAEAHIDSPDEPENRDWVKATYDYAFVSDHASRQAGLRLGVESDDQLSVVRPLVDGYLAGLLAPGAIAFLTGQAGWDHTDEEWIHRGLASVEYVGLAGPGTLRIRAMGGHDSQADWVHFESVEWWAPFDEKRDLYLDFASGYDLPDFARIDRRVKIGLRQNF